MEIASNSVLLKMEELVKKARSAESKEKLNGYIIAVQALCDIILDEPETTPAGIYGERFVPAAQSPVIQQESARSVSSLPQGKPAKMDEANGESLFDF
ncbi:hypothetical protein CVD28_06895 [Bacillus sp. M6-12]|uniref:YwdI family protein n=1 Tax=Bacillus sp. M6-12 TaxID=2054166 RepID=UPI000C78C6F2|nr:YwdI family protein [Bacillus sp. M6-12]PLS18391.1 hypothetical protein CVD28_06895 [Bacillus sp. M6-12]